MSSFLQHLHIQHFPDIEAPAACIRWYQHKYLTRFRNFLSWVQKDDICLFFFSFLLLFLNRRRIRVCKNIESLFHRCKGRRDMACKRNFRHSKQNHMDFLCCACHLGYRRKLIKNFISCEKFYWTLTFRNKPNCQKIAHLIDVMIGCWHRSPW